MGKIELVMPDADSPATNSPNPHGGGCGYVAFCSSSGQPINALSDGL